MDFKECFEYNKTTDQLIWIERPRFHFNSDRGHKCANSRCEGKAIEGAIHKNESSGKSYVRIKIYGKLYMLHRVIWEVVNGKIPDNMFIDHINGDSLDNRLLNFRLTDSIGNNTNCKIRKDNTSGVVGVSWHERNSKWLASITVNGKRKNLGYYEDLEVAKSVRKQAELDYGFHSNHGTKL